MNWILFALAGSVAQLIDGTLGMGFGLTSSTLLLTFGASAAVASAAVHAAEIGTTLVSGVSHWHAENVDKRILLKLAVPGGIGALLGATFLSWIDLSNERSSSQLFFCYSDFYFSIATSFLQLNHNHLLNSPIRAI